MMTPHRNRVSANPGRIKLRKEGTSTDEYYFMERADNPTEAGSLVNKQLLDEMLAGSNTATETTAGSGILQFTQDSLSVFDGARVQIKLTSGCRVKQIQTAAAGGGTHDVVDWMGKPLYKIYPAGTYLTLIFNGTTNQWVLQSAESQEFERFTDSGPSESIISLLFTAYDPDPTSLIGKIIGVTSARRQGNDGTVTMYISKIGATSLTIPLTLFDRNGNETTTMQAGQRAVGQLMLIYIASETKAYYLNPIDTGYTANESDQLYANALTGTGAGRMVSLTDVAPRAALSECAIQGQTTETGEGGKGPDNPYTITGVTPAKLTVCGKNLFDPVGQFDGLYAYADTYTGSGDMHPVNETYLGRDAVKCQNRTLAQGSNSIYYFLQDCFEPNAQYTFSFDWAYSRQNPDAPTNAGYYFHIRYTDGSYLMPFLGNTQQTVEWRHRTVTSGVGKTIKNVSFSWGTSDPIYLDFNTFQMERGATETAYAPYVGTEYPVSPGGAMHCLPDGTADTLDAATGKLTRYVASVTYNGTESWIRTTNGATDANNFFYTGGILRDESITPVCTHFRYTTVGIDNVLTGFITTRAVTRFRPDMSQFPDAATWKSWLAEHPVTVYYQLAEPTVTDITPKRIAPPAPEATIYPNAGNVSVGYNRDINIALQTISNAVIALGGGV